MARTSTRARSVEAARILLFSFLMTRPRFCEHGKQKSRCQECGGIGCVFFYCESLTPTLEYARMASARTCAKCVVERGILLVIMWVNYSVEFVSMERTSIGAKSASHGSYWHIFSFNGTP